MNFSDTGRPTMTSLLAFAGAHDVDRVVSIEDSGYPNAKQMRRFGPVERIGGVLVAPASGHAPLTDRDLGRLVDDAQRQADSGATISYCLDANFYELPVGLYPAGVLAGATPASFVAGTGLTCQQPAGSTRRGFATTADGVRPHTYPYYEP